MPFPREQAIDQHDLVLAAEGGLFSDFDDELSSAGHGETRRDFDFTEVPLPGQPLHGGQSHVVARPRPGVQQKVWVWEAGSAWYEDAQVDSLGKVVDQQGRPAGQAVPPQAHAPGSCPQCGCATLLPGGATAQFCPSCGTPQVQAPPPQAAAAPVPVPPPPPFQGPPPGYGIRMTGSAKPPVEVPPGLGKTTGNDDFMAFLDQAVEAGKEKSDEGPDPSKAVDE